MFELQINHYSLPQDNAEYEAMIAEEFEVWERMLSKSTSYSATSSSGSKKAKNKRGKHRRRSSKTSSNSEKTEGRVPKHNNVDNFLPFLSFLDDNASVDFDFIVDLDKSKDVANKDNKFDIQLISGESNGP